MVPEPRDERDVPRGTLQADPLVRALVACMREIAERRAAERRRLLAESNWSNPQIATIAGVSEPTVRRVATASNDAVDRPAETLGADGKYRPGRVVQAVVIDSDSPEHRS